LSALRKIADFTRCALTLGPDTAARAAILWAETRNLRVRLGLGRHQPQNTFSLRTTFGTLHFRDNFGDITNLTNLLYREVYLLPVPPVEGAVLDVGANIGMAAVWFGVRYPGHEVHCFEPLAENTRLVALNAPQAITNLVAVGGGAGTTTFAVDRDAVMASSIPYDRAAQQRTVEVIALDDYVRARGITRVAILKIDAEGMELEVLAGAAETLRRTHQIAMETHGRTRHQTVLDELRKAGFRIEREEFSGSTGLVFAARPAAQPSAAPR
jgi:FkbM family methyltransferase